MSMHKLPLTQLEEDGLRAHGLDIGSPSQLSDVFRQGVKWALEQTAPAQDERETPEVVAYRWRSSIHTVPNLTADCPPSASIHGYAYILPLMTVAQHERIVAALTHPEHTEQQPTLWARQCDLDEPGPAIFVAREQVEKSGYVVPFYAAPIAQTATQPEQSGLVDAVREAVVYLDSNGLNSITSGSTCHRRMRNALSATPSPKQEDSL